MQNLTVAGRLLITAIVLIGLYFGIRYFVDHRTPAAVPAATTATTGTASSDDETEPSGADASAATPSGERVYHLYSF